MDGDSFYDLLKVWSNLILKLVSLLAFSTLVDTTSLFADKVLSMLQCVFGLAVFCLVHGGLDKIGEMLNIDLVSKEMTLNP